MLLTNCSLTTDLIGIVVALVLVLVAYFKWTYSYWKNKGVESPPTIIPLGNGGPIFSGKSNIGELWKDLYNGFKQKGLPYGGAYFLNQKFFVPTDPELIKCIMQKDFQHFVNHGLYIDEEADPLSGHLFLLEDAKWKNLRVKLTPTFTSGKMKMMFQTLADCAVGLTEVVDEKSSEPVDIKEVLACFSTDIIASCAFGIECNSLKNPETEFRKYGRKVFEPDFYDMLKSFLHLLLPKSILKLFKLKLTKPDVESFFMDVVKKTVDYREKNNIYRKDFMHLLIQLKNMGKVTDDEKISEGKIGEISLNMNEIAAQAFVFFLAGFETSSTAMTFALYEIALNQEIQKKMREEINIVLKKYDNKVTYEAMMEMTYMEKVINETLRKYPPLPMLNRECNKDYKIPNSDLTIEKGTFVAISALGIHHDNEFYPNPVVFDPERFSEENKASRPPYTFLPFGEGPRICIGLRFGMMQAKVGLTTILKNYEITLNKKTVSPLTYMKNDIILSAIGGVWLNMKKISQ